MFITIDKTSQLLFPPPFFQQVQTLVRISIITLSYVYVLLFVTLELC